MKTTIAVVTGAARGMGFAAAEKLCEKYYVILTDVNQENLDNAVAELRNKGFECEGRIVDVSNRAAVADCAKYAASLGRVQAAVNIAGLSPSMSDGKKIWTVNAIGTINMTEEFTKVMGPKACILNFSSMSGDLIPDLYPLRLFHNLSASNFELYKKLVLGLIDLMPDLLGPAIGYVMSKNFVNYYAKLYSRKLVDTDIRVVTISPGDFATPMGMLEQDGASTYLTNSSIRRFGTPEEMAFLVDAVVDERNGYLTGCEIINDGGVTASLAVSMKNYLVTTVKSGIAQYHLDEAIKKKLPMLNK